LIGSANVTSDRAKFCSM